MSQERSSVLKEVAVATSLIVVNGGLSCLGGEIGFAASPSSVVDISDVRQKLAEGAAYAAIPEMVFAMTLLSFIPRCFGKNFSTADFMIAFTLTIIIAGSAGAFSAMFAAPAGYSAESAGLDGAVLGAGLGPVVGAACAAVGAGIAYAQKKLRPESVGGSFGSGTAVQSKVDRETPGVNIDERTNLFPTNQ